MNDRASRRTKRIAGFGPAFVVLCLLTALPGTAAADSVDITLPASVSFSVTDISQSTTGTPNPTTVSYTNYVPGTGSTLRISIQADSADFTAPGAGGNAIPANRVTWTAGAPISGGTTYSGSMVNTDSTLIYAGTAADNSFDLTWSLGAITPPVVAGTHSFTATWKIESL